MRYLLSLLILLCAPARADTLWLNNGDRLTGSLLYFDFGSLAFNADNIGRINVKANRIRTLETSGRIQVQLHGDAAPQRSHLQPGEPGTITLDDHRVVKLQDIDAMVRLRADIDGWQWDGNLDLALNLKQETGKREFEANTKLDTRLFNHRWRHGVKAEVERKTENDERKDNNYEINYDLDHFWSEHWFMRLHGRRDRDYLGHDTTENDYGGGAGYQFWDNEQGRFSLTTQTSRTEYKFFYDFGSVRLPFELGFNNLSLDWDYQQQVGVHGLELFTKGYVYHPYSIPIDYVTASESGIRYHITDIVHLSFRFEYDYTRLDLGSLIERHYFLGVGVNW